ncbi:unnamed protein product [Echinostoma caproni]|uniref:UDENN domain-containing protein n=1 Tax=Echinostoma caproni TaxID=27848 RepID=A0A183A8J1_9TREM|nr:unnamed protein product [Echinostoma caproni]
MSTSKIQTLYIRNLTGVFTPVNINAPLTGAKCNVARLDWLKHVLDQGKLIPWKPDDMLAMTKSTAEAVSSQFDLFGDSFCEPISSDELKSLCDRMPSKDSGESRASPFHSAYQWKLTTNLLEEFESRNVPIIGPLISRCILALSVDQSSSSKSRMLSDRLLLTELRYLGAIVLQCDEVFTQESLPEVVQFVIGQLGSRKQVSDSIIEPLLSHILLLGGSINDHMSALSDLQVQLKNAGFCGSSTGLQLVDESWARNCLTAGSIEEA